MATPSSTTLSSDARAYVPAALRAVFDEPYPFAAPAHLARTPIVFHSDSVSESVLARSVAAATVDDASQLRPHNYCAHFDVLLACEHARYLTDSRSYDLHSVKLQAVHRKPGASPASPDLLDLHVKGVEENKPALQIGSIVRFRLAERPTSAATSARSAAQGDLIAAVRLRLAQSKGSSEEGSGEERIVAVAGERAVLPPAPAFTRDLMALEGKAHYEWHQRVHSWVSRLTRHSEYMHDWMSLLQTTLQSYLTTWLQFVRDEHVALRVSRNSKAKHMITQNVPRVEWDYSKNELTAEWRDAAVVQFLNRLDAATLVAHVEAALKARHVPNVELRASVVAINLRSRIVTLKFPLLLHTSSCMLCGLPATMMSVDCGHIVTCTLHAAVENTCAACTAPTTFFPAPLPPTILHPSTPLSAWLLKQTWHVRFEYTFSNLQRLRRVLNDVAGAFVQSAVFLPHYEHLLHLQHRVFPLMTSHLAEAPPITLPWVDMRMNSTQRNAASAIVAGGYHPAAFLLLGPAGTGKTSVTLESCLHLLGRLVGADIAATGGTVPRIVPTPSAGSRSKVFLLAPSEEAADLLLTLMLERYAQLLLVMGFRGVAAAAAAAATGKSISDGQLIMRYCASERNFSSLPPSLLPFVVEKDGMFCQPPPYCVALCRLIVTTASGIGNLAQHVLSVLQPGAHATSLLCDASVCAHFNAAYMIVDEVSQALEPEALLALSMCTSSTRVVLTGDPRQLGPGVQSAIARARGLDMSLQMRLVNMYDDYGAAASAPLSMAPEAHLLDAFVVPRKTLDVAADAQRSMQVTLQRRISTLYINYRAHPALLTLPSKLFYQGTLVSGAPEDVAHSATDWSLLAHDTGVSSQPHIADMVAPESLPPQRRGFPLMVAGVRSGDAHEMDSPSYYNDPEAQIIVTLIKHVLTETGTLTAADWSSSLTVWTRQRGVHALPAPHVPDDAHPRMRKPLTQEDVGVVVAYRAQALRLRRLLRSHDLGSIRVDTIQRFQGQERAVMFVSTVLSDLYGYRAVQRARGRNDATGALAVGLFNDPRSFNVAITRAQSVLVCVGNVHVWQRDPYWRELLQYAVDNDAYMDMSGTPLEMNPSEFALFLPPAREAAAVGTAPSASPGGAASAASPLAAASASAATCDAEERSAGVDSVDAVTDLLQRLAHAQTFRETGSDVSWRLML